MRFHKNASYTDYRIVDMRAQNMTLSKQTLGSNCMSQASDGGVSRVATVALVSISKTRTKLSRDVEAAMVPAGCAATATTPSECPADNNNYILVSNSQKVVKQPDNKALAHSEQIREMKA